MTFRENNYQIVRNAIGPELLSYIVECCKIHENFFTTIEPPSKEKPFPYGDSQSPNSFSWYGSVYTDALTKHLRTKISDVVERNLIEAYSYFRTYYNGAILESHIDRPSCEYSATICLEKGSVDWPIYFDVNGKPVEVELNNGDMIVYRGDLLYHWRKPYTGNHHLQAFIHYVDSQGPYAESNRFDGRPALGFPSTSKHNRVQ
jgi:hypothetical protein